jgi:hypothetical protein
MTENKKQRRILIASFSVLFAATKAKEALQAKLPTMDQPRIVGDASRSERRAKTAYILIYSISCFPRSPGAASMRLLRTRRTRRTIHSPLILLAA